jgi:XRE family aerobic/anaerobic benzoate catabolism transcriptional regulator
MPRRSSSPKKKESSQPAFRKASVAARSNVQKKPTMNSYLLQLGENIRSVRARRGMTVDQLARASALSARFLSTVELGRGNISVGRLHTLARALDVPIEMLAAETQPSSPAFNQSAAFLKKLPPSQLRDAHKLLLEKFANVDASLRRSRIALVGLRGAGKSTLGSLLAQRLGIRFIELDKQIERDSGVTLTIIFDLYGPSGYRRMERQALESILAKHSRFVLATGGSIVSDPANYNRLLSECFTIWLRAKPEEHMARVTAQGDRRPMAHNRQAMRDLRRILSSREALYRQADTVVETTGQTVKQSLQALAQLLRP